jgi:uncharacterized repeat protein (TIGR02543 family)
VDIRVYAKWKAYPLVTFDADGGLLAENTAICAPGKKLGSLPDVPERDGYVFVGWFTGKNGGGAEFTAATVVSADITVYAKWIAEALAAKVTFYVSEGRAISTVICTKGENVALPSPDPTRSAYTFEGWFTRDGVQFTEATVVTERVDVYAKWVPYMVITFNTNFGVPTISTVICPIWETIDLPDTPVRSGYTFGGWFTAGGVQFTEATVVSANLTVYAKWFLNLTVNGALEPGAASIRFSSTGSLSLQKGGSLIIVASGPGIDWSSAAWAIRVDAEPTTVAGSGVSRAWVVPLGTQNGQYTVTVLIQVAGALYLGNFTILITN